MYKFYMLDNIQWICRKSSSLKCQSIFKTNLDIDNLIFIANEYEHEHNANEKAIVAELTKHFNE